MKDARMKRLLSEVRNLVGSQVDLDTILNSVLKTVALGLHAESASLFLLDETTGELVLEASYGLPPEVTKGFRQKIGTGSISGWVAETGESLVLQAGVTDERFQGVNSNIKSAISTAIKFEKETVGVINVSNRTREVVFTQDDLQLLVAIGNQCAALVKTLKLQQLLYERTRKLEEVQKHLVLQERLVALAELSSGIAHELKNPITIMLGLSELVEMGNQEPAEAVKKIKEQVVRASRIIDGLKKLSQHKPSEPTPVEVHSLIDNTISLLQHRLHSEGVELEKRYTESGAVILADEIQLQQILINLITNAIEAMEGQKRIVVETAQKEDRLLIKVSDTGKGIPQESLTRIFQPFFTTKETGSGLGLAVVKNLVEVNNGEIKIQSTPGKGTTVTLSFPCISASTA